MIPGDVPRMSPDEHTINHCSLDATRITPQASSGRRYDAASAVSRRHRSPVLCQYIEKVV